jgi:methylmalonyl-CoA/ethylmalonyl-CoA epimerase
VTLSSNDLDLDHVAVAMERWQDGYPRYRVELGGEWSAGGESVGFASAQLRYANGMKVELLSPNRTDENDFLRRFIDRNGPGPHHLTYKVRDIVNALEVAESMGYRPVAVDLRDPGWKEAFLHPKDAPGIVVQLAQSAGNWTAPPPDDFPASERSAPTSLAHVAHAVASMDDGLRLFRDFLAGQQVDAGEDKETTWVELGWKGPGRVRLVTPRAPGEGWVAEWLGDRPGRLLYLGFAGTGTEREVRPEDNLGVRIVTVS